MPSTPEHKYTRAQVTRWQSASSLHFSLHQKQILVRPSSKQATPTCYAFIKAINTNMLRLHQKQILMRQATPTCYKYQLPTTIIKANVFPLLTVNTEHNSETNRRKRTVKLCSPSIGQWKGLMPVCVKKWPFRHSGHEKCLSHWSHLNLHKFRCSAP